MTVKRNQIIRNMLVTLVMASLAVVTLCSSIVSASQAQENSAVSSDYSDENNWLSLPEITKKVDTFYIYPTAYNDFTEGAPVLCTLDNEDMRQSAVDTFETQATAYEGSTNVFAPYYRQINMAFAATATAEERDELLQGKPKADLFAALDYYFENLNEGRPYILAGHSQGSQMMTYVLSEYMAEHPEYYERMVAAYALGFSITEQFLEENSHLKFAENAYDNGVIISWNTEGEGNKDQENFVVEEGAISINPLNWMRDDTYAGYEQNLGARIKNEEKGEYEIIPEAADAQLDLERGVVITHTDVLDPMPEEMGFGPESYHGGDYELWYSNIEQNAARRVAYYLAEQSGRVTDYSDPSSWYMIPEITKDVDTFYIYPTLFMDMSDSAPEYAAIGDPSMTGGVEMMYGIQICLFDESTNLFVPYYQQANMTTLIEAREEYGDITYCLQNHYPQQDIWAALDYYFENYNEGRPFILAGHSQGSALSRLVLKEYFSEHPEYYERMIAAYVVGFSITQDDLDQYPHLQFAQGADDTGVIISWNVEGTGNKDADNIVVLPDAISINPLNWKLDDTYASAEENMGSRVQNEETMEFEIKDIQADAQVDTDRGVVICTTTETEFENMGDLGIPEIFGPESFHKEDYTFYFENVRENIRTRIDAYIQKEV